MKSVLTALLGLLLFQPAQSQLSEGMKFEHGLSWNQILEKAKKENKFIFVDVVTTWCAPCIYMSSNIFSLKDVGEFFNDKFIMVKVQVDTTQHDAQEIKDWYRDAHEFSVKYNLIVVPTYLYFDPKGRLVHRSGGLCDKDEFMTKARDALYPETQYYSMLKKYRDGKLDPALLQKLALYINENESRKSAVPLVKEYIATQKDLYTKTNLEFLQKVTFGPKDFGFSIFLANPAKVDSALGKKIADQLIMNYILLAEVYPIAYETSIKTMNFDSLSTEFSSKYSKYAAELMMKTKILFYQLRNDWPNFHPAVAGYFKSYSDHISALELNDFAWAIFDNCSNEEYLKQALLWSKLSISKKEDPAYIDTYANILHKLGLEEEAITWENKAISLSSDADREGYQKTLEKIKNKEKTWQQ
jgi:thioredoxin-related protein